VHAALASGEYTEGDLLRLAQRADAGFDQRTFGRALLGVDHAQDADFVIYGVGLHDVDVLRNRLRSWGEMLAGDAGTETAAPKNGCQ
jgi:hypothetical protein